MKKAHENYRELVWMLAKTDFKLRYQGSVLGYLWALLKPLLMFSILNFVFSSIFAARGLFLGPSSRWMCSLCRL
jgi:ABC-type polysaccharide/polyol phosphate export permease